jgi:hypothetical protein
MKNCVLLLTAVFFFSVAHAQKNVQAPTEKIQRPQGPVMAKMPAVQDSLNTDPGTLKRRLVISTEPAPKADPAREALARRKESQPVIEPVKSN